MCKKIEKKNYNNKNNYEIQTIKLYKTQINNLINNIKKNLEKIYKIQ